METFIFEWVMETYFIINLKSNII